MMWSIHDELWSWWHHNSSEDIPRGSGFCATIYKALGLKTLPLKQNFPSHLRTLRTNISIPSEVPLLFRSICWLVCSVLLFVCFLKQLISIFLSGFNLQPVLRCWNESASVPGIFFLWTGTNKLELDHSSLIFYKLNEGKRWTYDAPLNPVPLLLIFSDFFFFNFTILKLQTLNWVQYLSTT